MPVALTKDEMEDWLFNNKTVDNILLGDHPGLIKKTA